jgi:hypothetical protein
MAVWALATVTGIAGPPPPDCQAEVNAEAA